MAFLWLLAAFAAVPAQALAVTTAISTHQVGLAQCEEL